MRGQLTGESVRSEFMAITEDDVALKALSMEEAASIPGQLDRVAGADRKSEAKPGPRVLIPPVQGCEARCHSTGETRSARWWRRPRAQQRGFGQTRADIMIDYKKEASQTRSVTTT
jgi:hypothetical protein